MKVHVEDGDALGFASVNQGVRRDNEPVERAIPFTVICARVMKTAHQRGADAFFQCGPCGRQTSAAGEQDTWVKCVSPRELLHLRQVAWLSLRDGIDISKRMN